MQKKVIALAVAALASGAAMAQSNVTVYGWVDAEVQSVSVNNALQTAARNYRGIEDGQYGSRIGFKGEEALGSGLKAGLEGRGLHWLSVGGAITGFDSLNERARTQDDGPRPDEPPGALMVNGWLPMFNVP